MLKQKIINKEKLIGSHINLYDPAIGKIAGCGFIRTALQNA